MPALKHRSTRTIAPPVGRKALAALTVPEQTGPVRRDGVPADEAPTRLKETPEDAAIRRMLEAAYT